MNPHPKPDPTNDYDIDRVLTALTNTQPPADLERRVLAALEAGPSPAMRWHRWTFSPSSFQRWSVCACAGVIVLTAVAISVHRHPLRANVAVAPAATVTTRPQTQTTAAELAHTPVAPALRVLAKSIAPRATALTRSTSINHPRTVLCDCDPTALAEANAPSLPAPPLPLTEQEKLLLRIAHHPDPVELAELDPHQREASIAEEQAAYKRFFYPPAPPPQAEPFPQPDPQLQPEPATQQQPSTAAPTGDQP